MGDSLEEGAGFGNGNRDEPRRHVQERNGLGIERRHAPIELAVGLVHHLLRRDEGYQTLAYHVFDNPLFTLRHLTTNRTPGTRFSLANFGKSRSSRLMA